MKKILTLCIIHRDGKVLLGMKKRGFGAGRWNGFGGKVDKGEKIVEAAERELCEEAGITVPALEFFGLLEFEFKNEPETLEVHVFKARDLQGEPQESDEMRPQWFDIAEIPYTTMWPDDRYWLPLLLEDRKFRGKFIFDGMDKILEKEIITV